MTNDQLKALAVLQAGAEQKQANLLEHALESLERFAHWDNPSENDITIARNYISASLVIHHSIKAQIGE